MKIFLYPLQKKILPFCIGCLSMLPFTTIGQVTIDSTKTTVSTCPNNGSISMYARSVALPLIYSIVAGPVTAAAQTNNVFNSLPAGNYTVKVSDGAANSSTKNVTITGNYIPLDFSPIDISPYCTGGNNGQIIGNKTAGTGNGPFAWQIISPITTALQVSDTFNNLSAGNYTVRLTDGCSNVRTFVTTITDPPIAAIDFQGPLRVEMIGCDSGLATISLHTTAYRFPMTFTFETNSGTITTTTPTMIDTSDNNGYFYIQQLLPNFNYGDHLKVTVTNSCGNTNTSSVGYTKPFSFCPLYTYSYAHCNYLSQINFDLINPACYNASDIYTGIKAPLIYSFTDALTNIVVEADTIQGDPAHTWYKAISGVTMQPVTGNRTYNLVMKDGCGNIFSQSYFVATPVTPPPTIMSKDVYPQSCYDSSAFAFVFTDNFKTQPVLVLLSGPATMGSTKPGYTYSDTYQYPDTLAVSGFGGTVYRFDISNLSVGTYHFKVIDSCGSEVFDDLTVLPTDVTNYGHIFSYKKGCLGQNEIHYTVNTGTGNITIRNLATNSNTIKYYQSQNTSLTDSILNVASGTYEITYAYQPYFSTATQANHSILSCQTVIDTVVIKGYQTPTISTNNYIICKGGTTIELIPDSTKGVPPYQYEIIAGPQTFAVQSSNQFVVTHAGTYTARIYDVCGNASTAQVTVDTITFPPIGKITSGCNKATLFSGSSIYSTYKWTKPNGTIYTGDTLNIDPITNADTGIYKIQRLVNINGCKDTFNTVYHLLSATYRDSLVKSICIGQTYTVGSHTYNTTGIYRDTLSTVTSCDSIVILNLTVNAVCPTSRLCSGATHVVWKDDFGSGTPIVGPASSAINPAYINQNYGVISGNYSLVNYFNYQTCCWHKVTQDHTPNDVNGYFLVMDGGVPNFYTKQIDNLCPYTDYTFSTWTMNMDLTSFPSLPTFIFNVTDVPGNVLGQITTPAIPVSATPTWIQNGFTFNSGNNTSLKLNLILTSVGYNDFAFDDIEFSVCGPTLALTSTSSACTNKVNVKAVLGSGYSNPVYQWYKQDASGVWNIIPGANGTTYSDNNPLTNNEYKLTVKDGASACSFIEDSINVTLAVTPLIPVIVDTSICVGQSVLGHSSTGQYIDTLKGKSGCDSIKRTLNLLINSLKRDTINANICQGLQYPFGSKTYGSSGIYRDTLSTLTCDSIVVLNLTVTPASPIKIITNATEVNKGDVIQLNTVSAAPYLWISTATINNKNIQDPTAIINSPSWIYLYATSNCPSVDSVFITVRGDSIITTPIPCTDSYIRMPNAFTPNRDGQNDVFKPFAKNIRLESFQIYNRWGQMVFQSSDMNTGWDGNFQGQPMSIGNYVYWLTYYDCNHITTPELIKGNIILIR